MIEAAVTGPADPIAVRLLEAVRETEPAGASVLLNLDAVASPEDIILATESFAVSCRPGGAVVTLLRAGAGWEDARRVSTLATFTRHAALAWAPKGLRFNAIVLGVPGPVGWNACGDDGAVAAAPATAADIARVGMAMLRLRSMTGQIVRLAA